MIHRNPNRNKQHPAMGELIRAPPTPAPREPPAAAARPAPPPGRPPTSAAAARPSSAAGGPNIFKQAGAVAGAKPAPPREQARERASEEARLRALQAERAKLLEKQRREQRAAEERAAEGRAAAAREAAARARAAAADPGKRPGGGGLQGLGGRNIVINAAAAARPASAQTPTASADPELARLRRQRQLLEERRRELQRAREAEESSQTAARRREERDGYPRRLEANHGPGRNNVDSPSAVARDEYLARQRQAEVNRRKQLDDLGLGYPVPVAKPAGEAAPARLPPPQPQPQERHTKEWLEGGVGAQGGTRRNGGAGRGGGGQAGGGQAGAGPGNANGGVDHRANVLAAAARRRESELAEADAVAREAGRRIWLENRAAAHANRAKLAGNDVEAKEAAAAARVAAAEAAAAADAAAAAAAARAAATVAAAAAPPQPSAKPAPPDEALLPAPINKAEISATQRRAEFHAAKEAAERNRQRVLDEQERADGAAAADDATELVVAAGAAKPIRVPGHIARKLDRRQAEAAERRLRRGSEAGPCSETEACGDAEEVEERDYAPASPVDEAEVRRVEAEREEEAYSALLETLRELQLAQPFHHLSPDGGEDELGATRPAREAAQPAGFVAAPDEAGLTFELVEPGSADGDQLRESAAEQDLLAAGLMSGVDETPDEELGGAGEPSALALRRVLRGHLGDAAFDEAHARLQRVAEEEDDDALVGDLQRILGAHRLDKLPMMLQLIYLEEQRRG